MQISVVVPVYRAADCLPELHRRLVAALGAIAGEFEIIWIDDGSLDQSWEVARRIAATDPRVRAFRLSRNFGQHKAITAGLDQARGQWVVVMDCDLQDRPEEIPRLYAKAREGYEIVLAQRKERQDNFIKRASSSLFYRTLSYLTETHQDASVANFGIYHESVIRVVRSMRESIRYFPVMVRWVGFGVGYLDVQHASRPHGKSTYNFRRSLHLALDVMLSFSDKPVRLIVKMGLIISGLSLVAAISVAVVAMLGMISVSGWPSLIISFWFLSGIIIFILGVLGLYIGRIFEQTKGRPIYILRETTDPE